MVPAVADPPKLLTAEEFAGMTELGPHTELVKGEVFDVPPPSLIHSVVCQNIGFELSSYVRSRGLGRVASNDSGVVTERDPDTVRGADVAFFSYERVPKGPMPRGYPDVAPELVFEVLSPDDRWVNISAKITEYLVAGVKLVYVVDPERRQAMLSRPEVSPTMFTDADDLLFPDLFPDFRLRLGPLLD